MKNKFNRKIFIVDDEVLMTKSISRHLENLGYSDVTAFNSGVQAIEQLENLPEILFLDYQMDEMSGYEVLRKVKRFDPNIYVIMLSSQENLEAAVETLKFGAFDYIKKGDQQLGRITFALDRVHQIDERLLAPRESLFSKLFKR